MGQGPVERSTVGGGGQAGLCTSPLEQELDHSASEPGGWAGLPALRKPHPSAALKGLGVCKLLALSAGTDPAPAGTGSNKWDPSPLPAPSAPSPALPKGASFLKKLCPQEKRFPIPKGFCGQPGNPPPDETTLLSDL